MENGQNIQDQRRNQKLNGNKTMNKRKTQKLFRSIVKANQKIRPIVTKNIGKITKISSGSRDRLRELVRIRDDHTCQLCGYKWKEGQRKLDVHHIKGDKELTLKADRNFRNQITLCHSCHSKVDAWKMKRKSKG